MRGFITFAYLLGGLCVQVWSLQKVAGHCLAGLSRGELNRLYTGGGEHFLNVTYLTR